MAKAYASCIIPAPIERVWAVVRDFNAMPDWNPNIVESAIEDGRASDAIGCIRRFTLRDGSLVRERLLSLDDRQHSFAYNFETPAFPVDNYISIFALHPVTSTDETFATWSATFDETDADRGRYAEIVSNDVFAAGLQGLANRVAVS